MPNIKGFKLTFDDMMPIKIPLGNFFFLFSQMLFYNVEMESHYIPRRKSGIYWIQVRRAAAAAAAAAVEISLWTR